MLCVIFILLSDMSEFIENCKKKKIKSSENIFIGVEKHKMLESQIYELHVYERTYVSKIESNIMRMHEMKCIFQLRRQKKQSSKAVSSQQFSVIYFHSFPAARKLSF